MKLSSLFPPGSQFAFVAAILLIARNAGASPAVNDASDVTICEYSSKSPSLIGKIHASRIFTDYQRFGYFRIGFLPLLAVDDVQVKIESAEYLTNGLDDLASWRPSSGLRRMEIRHLQVLVRGEPQPRLCADVARPGKGGAVNLSTVSFRDSSGVPRSVPQATLQISGPSAGTLVWNAAGRTEKCLAFQPQPVKIR